MAKLQLFVLLVCMAIADSRYHSLSMPEPKPVADGIDLTRDRTRESITDRMAPCPACLAMYHQRWEDRKFCNSVKWSSTDGRCGPNNGHKVCNAKAVSSYKWCSTYGWCGNGYTYQNSGQTNYHFPARCQHVSF